ncbi:phosphoadenosine phosphosulfate reductase domain-containing protein, partial [Streptosporangium sandarakinum]
MSIVDIEIGLNRQRAGFDLQDIAESAAVFLEDAPALEIIRWAAATFGDRLCLTSSMSDALLIDLVSRVKPGIDVLFIDTGYHFAETIGTRDAVRQVYDVNVIDVKPSRTVAEQERDLGPRLFGRNPDLCCYLRKVEPLNRALEPYLAWVSGIR